MGMNGDEQRQYEELNLQLKAIQTLVRTDGWKLFESVLEISAEGAYKAMAETSVAHDAAKHLGAWHTVRNLRTWPTRSIEMIEKQMGLLIETAKQHR